MSVTPIIDEPDFMKVQTDLRKAGLNKIADSLAPTNRKITSIFVSLRNSMGKRGEQEPLLPTVSKEVFAKNIEAAALILKTYNAMRVNEGFKMHKVSKKLLNAVFLSVVNGTTKPGAKVDQKLSLFKPKNFAKAFPLLKELAKDTSTHQFIKDLLSKKEDFLNGAGGNVTQLRTPLHDIDNFRAALPWLKELSKSPNPKDRDLLKDLLTVRDGRGNTPLHNQDIFKWAFKFIKPLFLSTKEEEQRLAEDLLYTTNGTEKSSLTPENFVTVWDSSKGKDDKLLTYIEHEFLKKLNRNPDEIESFKNSCARLCYNPLDRGDGVKNYLESLEASLDRGGRDLD
ncbi:MAG: hypothetical protein WCF65_09000 [Parachlamydiaceae bacterium]